MAEPEKIEVIVVDPHGRIGGIAQKFAGELNDIFRKTPELRHLKAVRTGVVPLNGFDGFLHKIIGGAKFLPPERIKASYAVVAFNEPRIAEFYGDHDYANGGRLNWRRFFSTANGKPAFYALMLDENGQDTLPLKKMSEIAQEILRHKQRTQQ